MTIVKNIVFSGLCAVLSCDALGSGSDMDWEGVPSSTSSHLGASSSRSSQKRSHQDTNSHFQMPLSQNQRPIPPKFSPDMGWENKSSSSSSRKKFRYGSKTHSQSSLSRNLNKNNMLPELGLDMDWKDESDLIPLPPPPSVPCGDLDTSMLEVLNSYPDNQMYFNSDTTQFRCGKPETEIVELSRVTSELILQLAFSDDLRQTKAQLLNYLAENQVYLRCDTTQLSCGEPGRAEGINLSKDVSKLILQLAFSDDLKPAADLIKTYMRRAENYKSARKKDIFNAFKKYREDSLVWLFTRDKVGEYFPLQTFFDFQSLIPDEVRAALPFLRFFQDKLSLDPFDMETFIDVSCSDLPLPPGVKEASLNIMPGCMKSFPRFLRKLPLTHLSISNSNASNKRTAFHGILNFLPPSLEFLSLRNVNLLLLGAEIREETSRRPSIKELHLVKPSTLLRRDRLANLTGKGEYEAVEECLGSFLRYVGSQLQHIRFEGMLPRYWGRILALSPRYLKKVTRLTIDLDETKYNIGYKLEQACVQAKYMKKNSKKVLQAFPELDLISVVLIPRIEDQSLEKRYLELDSSLINFRKLVQENTPQVQVEFLR